MFGTGKRHSGFCIWAAALVVCAAGAGTGAGCGLGQHEEGTGEWGSEVSTPQDFVARWSFDEGSGIEAADESSHANAAALKGATWTTEARQGTALGFGGVNEYAEVPNAPSLQNVQEGSYTLSAWFRPASLPAAASNERYGVLMKTGRHLGLSFVHDGTFQMHHWLGSGTQIVATSAAHPAGSWHHVAGVVDRAAGTVQVYVNGKLEGTATFAPAAPAWEYGTATWKLGIGAPGWAQWRWAAQGQLDEAAIYARALNPSDVEALAAPAGAGLPSPWQSQDIGPVGVAGSTTYENGTFTVDASGADIGGQSDGFHFVYQPLAGDGELVARITSQENTNFWARAGVMIREDLSPNARNAMMVLSPGQHSRFHYRRNPGWNTLWIGGPQVKAPYWVRIRRQGNLFTGSVSADGSSWTDVGSHALQMGPQAFIGLVNTARNDATLNTTTFDGVPVSGGGAGNGDGTFAVPASHPRLFGDNARWLAYQTPLFDAPCTSSGNGWGIVTNVRDRWDEKTRGARICKGETPSLTKHPAGAYLATTPPDHSGVRAMQTLHLIRRMDACHAGGGTCDFSATDIDALKTKFIRAEMDRFAVQYVTSAQDKADPGFVGPQTQRTKNFVWTSGYAHGYDLKTVPLMRYWSLFLDTLWHDLTAAERALVLAELKVRTEAWIKAVKTGHWSFTNGNNWGPILGSGIAWYALAFFHEIPQLHPGVTFGDDAHPLSGQDLIDTVRRANEKHTGFYLTGGGYMEGTSYATHSFGDLIDTETLIVQTLGKKLGAYEAPRMKATANWVVDFVGSDGLLIDFGDAHSTRGHGVTALQMALWDEIVEGAPLGSTQVDACFARDFFANKYFDTGVRDPWTVQPALARNWESLVASCASPMMGHRTSVYPGFGATVRAGQPGISSTATRTDSMRYLQADGAMLALSGVHSTYAHMELDAAALVWTAFGNRLLADNSYGYIASHGDIHQGRIYDVCDTPDFTPQATNTLVIAEAFNEPADPASSCPVGQHFDRSQFYGTAPTVKGVSAGGLSGTEVDASASYGRDVANGWLSSFHRFAFPLGTSQLLVIDAMTARADRGSLAPQEYFFAPSNPGAACNYTVQDVAVVKESSSVMRLTPRCSGLVQNAAAEGVGRIHAASLRGGSFVVDGVKTHVKAKRTRFRWAPNAKITDDVRAFVLSSGSSASTMPPVSVSVAACGSDVCVRPIVEGVARELRLRRSGADWALVP